MKTCVSGAFRQPMAGKDGEAVSPALRELTKEGQGGVIAQHR
jgi:hypothetical protein